MDITLIESRGNNNLIHLCATHGHLNTLKLTLIDPGRFERILVLLRMMKVGKPNVDKYTFLRV